MSDGLAIRKDQIVPQRKTVRVTRTTRTVRVPVRITRVVRTVTVKPTR